MKLIKRFLQGGITSNVLLKGLTGLTLQAGLQLAKLASEILSTNSPQKNDFIKNESFVDPSAPVNYLTPAMQKGDKIPSSNGISLMAFFKHMIPGFREAYKMKLDQKQYDEIQRLKYRVRIPLLDYPILLPKLLSNNLQNSKNITKHLDGGEVNLSKLPTAQKVEDRYKGGRRVTSSSRYLGDSISVRGVESLTPWYKYPAEIVEYIRHSKVSPTFNDTTYAERPSFIRPMRGVIRAAGNNYYFGKKKRYMLPIVGGFVHSNYDASTPEEQKEYDTLKRRFNTAWGVAKHQEGGLMERADNTKVASRPLLVNNKIPYGAGKGPAGEGPMRLFNDPYVGIGMMAMAPVASRGFSSTKPASVNKFSTYIKGLPKSMSTSDKVAIGAGTVGGVALGYDDNHNQYVREGLRKMGIEFPLGLNPRGDSIYNDRHIFDNLLKYMLEYKR